MQKRESCLELERGEHTCAELSACVVKRDFWGHHRLPRAHRQCQRGTENTQSHPGKDREFEYRGEAVSLGSTASLLCKSELTVQADALLTSQASADVWPFLCRNGV